MSKTYKPPRDWSSVSTHSMRSVTATKQHRKKQHWRHEADEELEDESTEVAAVRRNDLGPEDDAD
jgi:hypothetical protein